MALESAQRIKALTDKINDTTGESDKTLSAAVDRAIKGYGKGGFPNGTEWARCVGIDGTTYCCAYCGGKWFVGGLNTLYYSDDGINFSVALKIDHMNTDEYRYETTFEKIMYHKGVYVALADQYEEYSNPDLEYVYSENYGVVYISLDGKNWTRKIYDGPYGTCGLVYGNGVWVFYNGGSYSGQEIYYSNDGINWIGIATGSLSEYAYLHNLYIEYGDGVFVGTHDYGVLYSDDGKNWVQTNLNGYKRYYNPIRGNGAWIINSDDGTYVSKDGKNWISGFVTSDNSITAYSDGMFVACTMHEVYWTHDAASDAWNFLENSDGYLLSTAFAPMYANGGWYINGHLSSRVYLLKNGELIKVDLPGTGEMLYIRYSCGIYIAARRSGLYYSSDGTEWAEALTESISPPTFVKKLESGGGTWLAVTGGGAYYSVTWKGEK